jgi:hypothetical protein
VTGGEDCDASARPLILVRSPAEDVMNLSADDIYADPRESDYPNVVGFRDTTADYCVILSRFSDVSPDRGTINVMVRDQIHTETANVALELSRSRCHLRLDDKAASELLGVRDYTIDFQADDATYRKVVELLKVIFEGLPGLSIIEAKQGRTKGCS